MPDFDDLLEVLFQVGVMALSYQIGQEAQKSLMKASNENDWLGMLFSAIFYGGSAYAFRSSARNLDRIIGKQRSLPA
jgi:hypothetical protein